MHSFPTPRSTPSLLSEREVEVLTQWLVCDSKRETGAALYISGTTVHTHLARIRFKYEEAGRPAGTKIALLIRAIEDGYVTLDEIAQRFGVTLSGDLDGSMTAGANFGGVERSCHSPHAAQPRY